MTEVKTISTVEECCVRIRRKFSSSSFSESRLKHSKQMQGLKLTTHRKLVQLHQSNHYGLPGSPTSTSSEYCTMPQHHKWPLHHVTTTVTITCDTNTNNNHHMTPTSAITPVPTVTITSTPNSNHHIVSHQHQWPSQWSQVTPTSTSTITWR